MGGMYIMYYPLYPNTKTGRTLDIGQERIGTVCDGPSSEPYRILWSE